MSTVEVKTCSNCGKAKPKADFATGRSKCKGCTAEYQRKYQAANREQLAELKRQYQAANREQIAEYNRQYHAANREHIAERQRQQSIRYRESNREQLAERNRRYRAANRKRLAEYHRKYKEANREQIAEYDRRYFSRLPDAYVARILIGKKSTLTRADIPSALLEAKRLQLKLLRLSKEQQQ